MREIGCSYICAFVRTVRLKLDLEKQILLRKNATFPNGCYVKQIFHNNQLTSFEFLFYLLGMKQNKLLMM